ncbi:MAG: RNA polymerase sporulation sigma factor SigH [Tindallia sp. MSAO_Bac2]|nr:MAG: RNA polymerase sporulation sigma factor SigH [Tindallia sp. MSAO_Bac2]
MSMGVTKKFCSYTNLVDEETLSDEIILKSARDGDLEALEILMNRYKNFVKAKARSYFLIGADREDIVQEGMIGLFKAVRDYCNDKPSSFKVFAELCITRQMITAIKTATRQKHIPLNSYVSLNKPVCENESDRTLMEMVSGQKITNPEELMISQEELNSIEDVIGEMLSNLEMKVLMLYINGRSYQEIAKDLKRPEKSIDNALQRVKRKLEKYLERRDHHEGY